MSLTGGNYRAAIDILKNRYGNKQAIISAHMDSLINLPTVRSCNETQNLRKLYDLVESNLRSLESLGIDNESYGCLLVPIVLHRNLLIN